MQSQRDIAVRIVRTLQEAGHTAYFAGGCVRDELLGLFPQDYDVATDATPDHVRKLFHRSNEVGASFGVMIVRFGSDSVEVATFRKEGAYSDRRRPDAVHYADAPSDAQRRDFTINALFLDPLAPADHSDSQRCIQGKVIDYVGGLDDLRNRILRAVGDPNARLAEDHLRALRAVRIAARLDFEIEAPTAESIRQHASELQGVSRERIGDELRKMLASPTRNRAIELMESLGLDAPALNEEPITTQADALQVLDKISPDASFSLSLTAWAIQRSWARAEPNNSLPAIAKPLRETTARWRTAMCLSNAESSRVGQTLQTLETLEQHWDDLAVAAQKRLMASPHTQDAMALLHIIDPNAAAKIDLAAQRLASDGVGISPPPLLTGDDLISIGFTSGPFIGDTLQRLYDLQLDGEIGTLEEALQRARTALHE
jgi:poly(A) polymerase